MENNEKNQFYKTKLYKIDPRLFNDPLFKENIPNLLWKNQIIKEIYGNEAILSYIQNDQSVLIDLIQFKKLESDINFYNRMKIIITPFIIDESKV